MSHASDASDTPPPHTDESTREATLRAENEKLLSLASLLTQERARLESEVKALKDQLGRHREIHWTLLERVSQMEASNRDFVERYVGVEQQNTNLANLYVASHRIHGSLDRKQLLTTIEDIIINLVGSEEFAVLERTVDGALRVATSFGVEAERLLDVCGGKKVVEDAILRGATYVASTSASASDSGVEGAGVTACVPMKVDDHVVGAIVVFRLLAHKPVLEALDHELFGLLATHGATALYCCELHARTAAEARA